MKLRTRRTFAFFNFIEVFDDVGMIVGELRIKRTKGREPDYFFSPNEYGKSRGLHATEGLSKRATLEKATKPTPWTTL